MSLKCYQIPLLLTKLQAKLHREGYFQILGWSWTSLPPANTCCHRHNGKQLQQPEPGPSPTSAADCFFMKEGYVRDQSWKHAFRV